MVLGCLTVGPDPSGVLDRCNLLTIPTFYLARVTVSGRSSRWRTAVDVWNGKSIIDCSGPTAWRDLKALFNWPSG